MMLVVPWGGGRGEACEFSYISAIAVVVVVGSVRVFQKQSLRCQPTGTNNVQVAVNLVFGRSDGVACCCLLRFHSFTRTHSLTTAGLDIYLSPCWIALLFSVVCA